MDEDLSDELGKEVEGSWWGSFDLPLLERSGWACEYVQAVLEEIHIDKMVAAKGFTVYRSAAV